MYSNSVSVLYLLQYLPPHAVLKEREAIESALASKRVCDDP